MVGRRRTTGASTCAGRNSSCLWLHLGDPDESGPCKRTLPDCGQRRAEKKWLYRLATGDGPGAVGITEPNAGSDVAGMKTTATKTKGGWLLNGSKIFITQAGVAGTTLVICYTDKSKGNRGMSIFVLEKDAKGMTLGKPEHKLGIRGSDTRQMFFHNCFVPDDQMIGPEGSGFKTLMNTFQIQQIVVANELLR